MYKIITKMFTIKDSCECKIIIVKYTLSKHR